jgi:hypothetical protein
MLVTTDRLVLRPWIDEARRASAARFARGSLGLYIQPSQVAAALTIDACSP